MYSALLLECQLVRIKTDAARTVCVREDAWKDFIVRNDLRGDHDGRGSCVEITAVKMTKSAIERTMLGGGDINLQPRAKSMYVLRVGKISQGERAPKCAAINEPPGMNDAMRIAKMKLCRSTEELQSILDEAKMDDIATVKAWVLMSNIEQHDRSKWKREKNDNNIDDEEEDDDADEDDDVMRQSEQAQQVGTSIYI